MTTALLLSACLVGRADAQRDWRRVDEYLSRPTGAVFSGVVLLARGDSVLFERAYGMADADLAVPNTPALRFGIGSLTKPITAVAALRLVERGRLRLDGSVCQYLARCPPAWRPVSLRHLLSHTSGVPDLFGELPAAPVDSTRAVIDAAIARHTNDSLLSVPGTRYRYSNFNYFLVGYALEIATGASWESILREEVFGPAGMTDTEYDDVWAVMPGRVRGYAMVDGAPQHIRYRDHAAYAAGGLLSTARDLLLFDSALTNGRLLGDATFRAMSTRGLGDYGMGWQVITVFGRTLRNHSGGTNGFSSHLAYYNDETRVIVLSNIEAWNAKATACDIAAIYFGLAPSPRSPGTSACRPAP